MRMISAVVVGCVAAVCAFAEPQLEGTAEELARYVSEIPGRITLTADAELSVDADRAAVVVTVLSSDRSLEEALSRNRRTRAEVVEKLKAGGIAADRIRMSRFSSSPQQSFLTSKVKSYDIESRVTIDTVSEDEIQTVAAIVDENESVSLASLSFRNTREDKQQAEVVSKALDKINGLKSVYEQKLAVTLVPRAVGPQVMPGVMDSGPRRCRAGKEVSGLSVLSDSTETGLILHALAASPPPDLNQFDQVQYRATVSVIFDVDPLNAR